CCAPPPLAKPFMIGDSSGRDDQVGAEAGVVLSWGAGGDCARAIAFARVRLPRLDTSICHARLVAGFAFLPLAAAEFWGLARLVRCCAQREPDLISVLAFGALLIVLVIAIYSAFFLAVVANRLY